MWLSQETAERAREWRERGLCGMPERWTGEVKEEGRQINSCV